MAGKITRRGIKGKAAGNSQPAAKTGDATLSAIEVKPMTTLAVKVKAGGEYGSWGSEYFLSKQVPADSDLDAAFDEMTELVQGKLDAYVEQNAPEMDEEVVEDDYDPAQEVDTSEEDEVTESFGDEEPAGDEEGEEITEDDIKKMTKKEIVALVKDEGLDDFDISGYKNIASLRKGFIEYLFSEEEEGVEGDEGDEGDDWNSEDFGDE